MEYRVGRTGRVIAARLFEGENLYESIEPRPFLMGGAVLITGGFREANVVVGPKTELNGKSSSRNLSGEGNKKSGKSSRSKK